MHKQLWICQQRWKKGMNPRRAAKWQEKAKLWAKKLEEKKLHEFCNLETYINIPESRRIGLWSFTDFPLSL